MCTLLSHFLSSLWRRSFTYLIILAHLKCSLIPLVATKNFRKRNRLRIQENTATSGAIVLKLILVILDCLLELTGMWSPCDRKTGTQKTSMIIQRQPTLKMVFLSVLNVRELIGKTTARNLKLIDNTKSGLDGIYKLFCKGAATSLYTSSERIKTGRRLTSYHRLKITMHLSRIGVGL